MKIKRFYRKLKRSIIYFIVFCGIIVLKEKVCAITLVDYNKFIEEGRLYNLGDFDARYNPNVLKYRKYGHFTYDGTIIYPSGNPETPFNEVNGDRILADQAISTDKTYKVTGQFDYDGMDYSYYDMEGLSSTERNRYEFQSRLDSLVISDRESYDQGYGAYNLRAGKNIVSFINFAYDFYKNQSGEKRVGCETKDDLAARGITSGDICPMEALKGYQGLSHTKVELFDYNIFNILFRKCTTDWEYQGNKEIANSGSIFANLQYYYMALVYLQPGLKKFKSMKPNDFNGMDENDNAAFLSMMFERFGGRAIIPENYEARNMVNRLGEIGEYELLPALIDDGLDMDVGERIYRYMIEIKWKNNPEALARWISEYNEVYGEYEILSAEDYEIFKKACDEGYRKHADKRSIDTALDFGYVIDPSKFESRISFDDAVAAMADHYQNNFQDSQFYKNRNNAEYVARTYAMVKAMCENDAFTDITDIYACIVNLVEHSYGYDSTEILLTDTQVVHLMAGLDEGDYDTDHDNLLDRQELNHEENVNISNLLEEYINYNRIPEEEANKLRADPYIKMWAYKSNPALPDTDFDGRNDDFDIHRPLENRQSGKMSTLNYEEVNFDYNQDYRYFAMKPDQYYYDLSEMSMVLANMVNKKSGINRRWLKDTNYINRIANDSGGIDIEEYRERYNAYSVEDYMNYIGLEDIEVRDMSSTYEDSNVCRYAIGHRDVVYSLGRTSNVVRNVIAISIGDIEAKAAELYANFDGHGGREGSNTEYHHIGFDIVANRIFETLERYASRYDPRYQKVYWITGEAGGGSVANLLAQKMIKKYGNTNIYCYTFQALNTINCNNIPAVQRISNEPYGSIFNLYNDDNQVLQIYTNEANFYMYGVRKHVAVSNSRSYINLWQNSTGVKYDITADKDYAKYFIKGIVDELDRGMVSGFAFTEEQIERINDYVKKLKETNDAREFEKLHIDLVAYFVQIGLKYEDKEFKFDDPNDHKIYVDKMDEVGKMADNKFLNSSSNASSIPDALDGVDGQNAVVYTDNGPKEKTNADDEIDPRDGVPFVEYDINGYKAKCNFDNKDGEGCVRIGEFVYSNYTLPKSVSHYDIDYSKFWNDSYTNDGSKLFEYKMGDVGESTKITFTGLSDAQTVNKKSNLIDSDESGQYKTFGNNIISIDDRIVAYFPIPVYSKGGEDISLMHKFNNYYDESSAGKYHGFNGKGGMKEDKSVDLNLVDVVFEKYDTDGAKHQFVVPFVVGGTKWLHQSEAKKMYSMFTDNRYGQITENIVSPDLNSRVLKGYANYYYKDGDEDVLKEKKLQNSELGTKTYIGFAEASSASIIKTIDNTYPSYKDRRSPIICSPIEPIILGDGDNDIITSCIVNQIFGSQDTRIVSMRVYNLDVEEQIGESNSSNWKKNINIDLPLGYSAHNGDFNFKYTDWQEYFDWYDEQFDKLNQIIKYPSINNSE